MTSDSGPSVFLSYASQDGQVAQRIADALRAAGVTVWFDRDALCGGDAWDRDIRGQVLGCALFIPVVSANTEARHEGYFRIEWNLAAQRTHAMAGIKAFLLPVVIDTTHEARAVVPEEFRAVQWTRMPDGDKAAEFAARVALLLAAPAAPSAAAHHPVPSALGPRSRRSTLFAGLAIGAAVIAGALYYGAARTVSGAVPVSAAPALAADPSIAVLPFANMSSDKEQEFFSDGISEELLTMLTKVPRLRVIARTSSFAFKGEQTSIADIGKRLHVASILAGSVRKSGKQVRISVQLIRAEDGVQLWSETYERTVEDIFKVQDEIAAAVLQQLTGRLLGAAPVSQSIDPRAYEFILQANYVLHYGSSASREQAILLYKKALAIAPQATAAWNGLAMTYDGQATFGELPPIATYGLAREAARRSLESNPNNALAEVVLGRLANSVDDNLPAAAAHFQRALALEPALLEAIGRAATLLNHLGRSDEALSAMEFVCKNDPESAYARFNLGRTLYDLRQWDRTIANMRAAMAISPDYASAHYRIAMAQLGKGDNAAALASALAEHSRNYSLVAQAVALQRLGRRAESDAALRILTADAATAFNIAFILADRGDADGAFTWLDTAVAVRDSGVPFIPQEPMFDKIHGDARWLPFLRKIGRAPEQLAAVQLKFSLPK
ncbi:MAG: TIR domain-containing protein [Pseudomonadota bacterium]